MPGGSSSPARSPAVKKTYLGRRKHLRRESTSHQSDTDIDMSTVNTPAHPATTPGKRQAPRRGKSLASSSPAPNSSPTKPPTSAIRTKPISKRGASIASSENGVADGAPMMTTWSANRATITRTRKSEDERVQYFKSDPLCKEIEAHRALCARCTTWVDLNPKRRYIMKEWVAHRKGCGKGTDDVPLPPPPTGQEDEDDDDDEEEEENPSPIAPTPVASPASADKPKRQVRTEFERKAILEADPLIGDVKPHEVYCKQCSKWIRLNPTQKYTIGNWTNHVKRCSLKKTTVVPGEDSAETKPSSPTKSIVDHTSPNGKANGTTASRKRAREDDEDTDTEDRSRTQSESRAVKPRTENYKPPEGLWRRLTSSFRSFIDGFRQGLADEETDMVTDGAKGETKNEETA
ncbi:hypothetical protein QCA50_010982 [Cerrena zonata]|uniref:Uncharacterized protein n=1 Tax=Cerrena zonata TaxID=2478898 RepID=A0AAW0G6P1_9APHY